MDTIGQRMRSSRKAAGLSQTEVAEAVGVSQVRISAWERDESAPRLTHAVRLADLFAVDLEWLAVGRSAA